MVHTTFVGRSLFVTNIVSWRQTLAENSAHAVWFLVTTIYVTSQICKMC